MSKISIIIPVYNCRDYLEKCVRSVLAQTHTELQLILVDDGSTDGSEAICDALGAEDDRILVIHQKNAGVSAARNAGLDAATGEYVGFVDADDYIVAETYQTALCACADCDIVMWDAITVWSDGRKEEDTIPVLKGDCVLERSDWNPELLSYMAGAVWRCLYRTDLLKDVRFPLGIKLSEDRLFNLYAMGKARKLHYLKRGMYLRYVRAGSAVHRYHGDKFEKNLQAMEIAKDALKKYWSDNYLSTYTRMLVIGGALAAIYEISSREFLGKSRRAAIRQIAVHEALADAFRICPAKGLREKLLKGKAVTALLAVGILYNWKNGRQNG